MQVIFRQISLATVKAKLEREPGLHFHHLGGRRTRLEERGEGLRKELSAEGLQAPAFHGESLLRAVSRELSEWKPNFRYLRRD